MTANMHMMRYYISLYGFINYACRALMHGVYRLCMYIGLLTGQKKYKFRGLRNELLCPYCIILLLSFGA